MQGRIPEYLDPYCFAEREKSFTGKMPLSAMHRLGESLVEKTGDVHYEFNFLKEDKTFVVRGSVRAELKLECQVCCTPMDFSVDASVNLAAVSSLDEAGLLQDCYDPLLVVERKISAKEIVEDELLLALPIIPKHSGCKIEQPLVSNIEKPDNPFSVLADLKHTGDH